MEWARGVAAPSVTGFRGSDAVEPEPFTNHGPHLNPLLLQRVASKKAKGRELPAEGWCNMI